MKSSVSIAPAIRISAPPPPLGVTPPVIDPRISDLEEEPIEVASKPVAPIEEAGAAARNDVTLRDIQVFEVPLEPEATSEPEEEPIQPLSEADVPISHPHRNYTLPEEPSFEISGLPEMDLEIRTRNTAPLPPPPPVGPTVIRAERVAPSAKAAASIHGVIWGAVALGTLIVGVSALVATLDDSGDTQQIAARDEISPATREESAPLSPPHVESEPPQATPNAEPNPPIEATTNIEPAIAGDAVEEPVEEVVEPDPAVPQVRVRIHTRPRDATLVIDGAPAANPFEIETASSDAVHEVSVSADGFEPRLLTIQYDRNLTETVRLEPARPLRVAQAPAPMRQRPAATNTTPAVPAAPPNPTAMQTGQAGFVTDNPY